MPAITTPTQVVFFENDNLIELTSLKDEITDALISNATVTVTVEDESGTEIAGQTWPTTMTAIVGTAGGYRATLSKDIDFVSGTNYVAVIDVLSAGTTAKWKFRFNVRERRL